MLVLLRGRIDIDLKSYVLANSLLENVAHVVIQIPSISQRLFILSFLIVSEVTDSGMPSLTVKTHPNGCPPQLKRISDLSAFLQASIK